MGKIVVVRFFFCWVYTYCEYTINSSQACSQNAINTRHGNGIDYFQNDALSSRAIV